MTENIQNILAEAGLSGPLIASENRCLGRKESIEKVLEILFIVAVTPGGALLLHYAVYA